MNVRIVLALAGPRGEALAEQLEREGVVVAAVTDPVVFEDANLPASLDLLDGVDALVLAADRRTLGSHLVSVCDRRGIRIVPLEGDPDGERVAVAFGLAGSLVASRADAIAAAVGGQLRGLTEPPDDATTSADHPGRVIVVWGPDGAPGRTTVASLLAFELARGRGAAGRGVALVDADSHAPSIAIGLGLADEGPGFPAACRQAGLGDLDARELTRISSPIRLDDTVVDVLCGINRRGRWPELAADRVASALAAARDWAAYTVVDVGAPLEQDEELMADLAGPRRNAAAVAALREADVIVAVCSADPIGIARFVRGYAELRAIAGSTPVLVVANRLRAGGLGLDARGQIRRTLERFAGVRDVAFVPADTRTADAATLAALPIAAVAPRSALVTAIRRFAGEALLPALGRPDAPVAGRAGRSRTVGTRTGRERNGRGSRRGHGRLTA